MMKEKYSPKGYDEKKTLPEKLLFSAPEYFFYETRPGRWIVLQLQRMLDRLNNTIISRIPSRTVRGGFTDRLVDTFSDYISRILSWINSLFEREQEEKERTLHDQKDT